MSARPGFRYEPGSWSDPLRSRLDRSRIERSWTFAARPLRRCPSLDAYPEHQTHDVQEDLLLDVGDANSAKRLVLSSDGELLDNHVVLQRRGISWLYPHGPEKHYLRGPGPKRREIDAATAIGLPSCRGRRCPGCERLRCRLCLGLRYTSQLTQPTQRMMDRAHKIARRLE